MWLSVIREYWKELAVAIFVGLALLTIMFQHQAIKSARSERDQYKTALDFQNSAIMSQKADYEAKMKQLPKTIEKIRTRYVRVYEDIDTIGEHNESNQALFDRLNTFVY